MQAGHAMEHGNRHSCLFFCGNYSFVGFLLIGSVVDPAIILNLTSQDVITTRLVKQHQQVSVSSTSMWTAVVSLMRAGHLQVCSGQWKTCRGNSSSCRRPVCNKTLAGLSLTRRASPPPSSPGSTARASARRSSPRPSAGTSTPSALSLSARRLQAVQLLHQGHKLQG